MTTIREIFTSGPEFCNLCGSILAVRTGKPTDNECSVCQAPIIRKEEYGILETSSYVVHFNDRNVYSSKRRKRKNDTIADGPTVSRDCKQCGHDKMTYATIQLRSADEGQTVFFTCPKCKFKESENS